MLFTKLEYTSSKFFEWDWYDLFFRGYCQSCSPQFSRHMKHKFQSREWNLPLLVDAIAASHYQHLILEGKKDCITLHIYTHNMNHIASSCEGITIFPLKSLLESCSQVNVTAYLAIARFSSYHAITTPDMIQITLDLLRGARRAPIKSQIFTPISGLGLRKYSYNQNLR